MQNCPYGSRPFILLLTLSLAGGEFAFAQQPAQTLPDAPSAVNRQMAQAQTPATQDPAAEVPAEQSPTEPRVVPVQPEAAPGTEPAVAQPETTAPTQDQPVTPTQPASTPAATPAKPAGPPIGTAAAESAKTAGAPASRPAGVAIAGQKQKRSRSLLIKLGALAAAGAAIGTVYALSRGTSSLPPNAVH